MADQDSLTAEHAVNAIEKTGTDLGEFATGRPGRVSRTYEKSAARLPYLVADALTADERGEIVAILRDPYGAQLADRRWPE